MNAAHSVHADVGRRGRREDPTHEGRYRQQVCEMEVPRSRQEMWRAAKNAERAPRHAQVLTPSYTWQPASVSAKMYKIARMVPSSRAYVARRALVCSARAVKQDGATAVMLCRRETRKNTRENGRKEVRPSCDSATKRGRRECLPAARGSTRSRQTACRQEKNDRERITDLAATARHAPAVSGSSSSI